jgi:hypothetical protein
MELAKLTSAKINSSSQKDRSSFFSFGQDKKSNKPFFQPKLTINQPNDPFEKEADAVAERIMRMEQPGIQLKPLSLNFIQRKCAHCEEEEKKVQRKEIDDKEATGNSNFEKYVEGLSNTGDVLSNDVRNYFEPRFGYDFSNVKIHTNSAAASSAESISALAFTTGSNIVFNAGQYSPNTEGGKKLLGHELTHVIQQRKNSIAPKTIQRDKIPHRTLTLEDFKGKPTKGSSFDAETFSGFDEPDWAKSKPASTVATDTGKACKIGKNDSTLFTAGIAIDEAKIATAAFMLQEKSWKQPWTTDTAAREAKCKAKEVKDCKAAFAKLFTSIESDCKNEKEPKKGEEAKQGNVNMKFCKEQFPAKDKISMGEKEIEVTPDNCSSKLSSTCITEATKQAKENNTDKKQLAAETKAATDECKTKDSIDHDKAICDSFFPPTKKITFDGKEVAVSRKDCKAVLTGLCISSGQKSTTVDFEDSPTLTKPAECDTVLLTACKTTMLDNRAAKLLAHEQLHFDLTNALAEKTNTTVNAVLKKLPKSVEACGKAATEAKAASTLAANITKLTTEFSKMKGQLNASQTSFDAESVHGINEKNQALWEENINKGLPDKSVLKKK